MDMPVLCQVDGRRRDPQRPGALLRSVACNVATVVSDCQ